MGTQRNLQADQRRRQILAVARERFVADGYSRTSVSSIVRAAGIAQGTFYLYFKSKQDVLVELRRDAVARYEAPLQALSVKPGPADLLLASAVSQIVEVLRELMPLERVFRAAENAENTQRAALNGRRRLAKLAAVLIEQGIEEGAFQACPPMLTAQFIITLFDNVLYDALAHEQPGPVVQVAKEGIRFSMRALGVGAERIEFICSMVSLEEESL